MDENKITIEEEVMENVEEAAACPAEELNADTPAEEVVTKAAETAEDAVEKAVEAAQDIVEKAAGSEDTTEEETGAEADTAAEDAPEEIKSKVDEIVGKLKALVKEGNVTFIRIRKDDTVVLNLPMTVGIIGTVLGLAAAPWVVIIATITTVGLKCTVEVEKKDGSIVLIHGKGKNE